MMATEVERKKRRRLWWEQHKGNKGCKGGDASDGIGKRSRDSDKKSSIRKKAGTISHQKTLVSSRGFRRTTTGDGTTKDRAPTTSHIRLEVGSSVGGGNSDTENFSDHESSHSDLESDSSSEQDARIPSIPSESRLATASSVPKATGVSSSSSSKKRYILFFGNLPYDSTSEEIVVHFERRGVPIKALRLLTNKETGKSRGCAFADFDSNRTMQNALKFHRSRFKGKRINIEVTCGGGGSNKDRKEKIREKNRSCRKRMTVKRGKYFKKK